MGNKIVIIVRGGNVVCCFANDKNVEIEMLDFDNIQENGLGAMQQAEARVRDVEATMHQIY